MEKASWSVPTWFLCGLWPMCVCCLKQWGLVGASLHRGWCSSQKLRGGILPLNHQTGVSRRPLPSKYGLFSMILVAHWTQLALTSPYAGIICPTWLFSTLCGILNFCPSIEGTLQGWLKSSDRALSGTSIVHVHRHTKTWALFWVFKYSFFKTNFWRLEGDSEVKSAFCSSRGPEFGS